MSMPCHIKSSHSHHKYNKLAIRMAAWEHQIFNAVMSLRSTVKYISVNMKHGCQKRDEVTQRIPRLNKTPAFSLAAGWEWASFSRVPCFSPAVCKTSVPSSLSASKEIYDVSMYSASFDENLRTRPKIFLVPCFSPLSLQVQDKLARWPLSHIAATFVEQRSLLWLHVLVVFFLIIGSMYLLHQLWSPIIVAKGRWAQKWQRWGDCSDHRDSGTKYRTIIALKI